MSGSSISAMQMLARVSGKGDFTGKLHKHLSPVTLTKIQQALPISGRVNFYEKDFVYILTSVVTGEEKSKKEFKRGEIAFMPAGCMLCFFLRDTRSYKPMNALGEVDQGISLLESCRRGDLIEVEKITLGS